MNKHSDLSDESIYCLLLISVQLIFSIGTGYYVQDAVMAREKTELLYSDISKNNQFVFYFDEQITEQPCFSIANQVLWKSFLSNYNIQILEKLKRLRLNYISYSVLLREIFIPIKKYSEKESLQYISFISWNH
jgi:hypothetical protein